MDYNTGRKKLLLPEYGRNIQKMVNHLLTIEDKEERNKQAKAVVAVMGNLNPHLRDISDFKHKLWDHIAIISDFKLDIDFPYDVPQRELLTDKPKTVPYHKGRIRFRHYGRVVEEMIAKACDFEEGEEKDLLILTLANHMKKVYLIWNKETVEDTLILNDLRTLAQGKLDVPEDLRLTDRKEILQKTKKKKNIRRK